VKHSDDCQRQRIEVEDLPTLRQGQARITRCVDCGGSDLQWLVLPQPKHEVPEELMRPAGNVMPGAELNYLGDLAALRARLTPGRSAVRR